MIHGNRGAVLVVALLLTLAMLGVAHGLLVSAETGYAVSRAHARVARLDAAASGLLEEEQRGGWSPWMDSIAWGQTRVDPWGARPGPMGTVRWRRLGAEAWILGAVAADGVGAAVRWRRLVWIYRPDLRVASLPGVVSAGPGAVIDILGAVIPDLAPAVGVVDTPALGPMDMGHFLVASEFVGEKGTPTPVEAAGVCLVGDVWNWGEPRDSTAACGAHFALVGRSGNLTVSGGVGQGVWVVDGDVTVGDGARLSGVLIASGHLDVTGGSAVRGRVIAFGGFRVEVGSVIVGSPSDAERALEAVRERLGAAVPIHPARRLGPG